MEESIFVCLMVLVLRVDFLQGPIGGVILRNLDWEAYPGYFHLTDIVKDFMEGKMPHQWKNYIFQNT